MPIPSELEQLRKRRDDLRRELASVGDLRPGSLVSRYRKCGRPNCHCATEPDGGHGPSWSLTHQFRGKTVTRIIPAAAVAQTRAQIAEYQRLRRLTRELVEVSERLCEAQLRASAEAASAAEAAKKGASKKPSRPRLVRRSRGS